MTPPDQETADESLNNPLGELPSFGRRPLLKALGAGAAFTVASGRVSADHDPPHPPQIDSHYGYSTPDAEDIPEKLEPDREIELHIDYPPEDEDPEDHAPFYGHFEPSGQHVDPGEIIQFTFESPEHTITAYHQDHHWQQRVPENAPPFSSPIVNVGGAWLYQFDESGVYDLDCAPHNVFGMVMRLVVGDVDEDAYPPSVKESWKEWEEGNLSFFPPWNKPILEFELNHYSAENDGAEWPWMTPQEVFDSDPLHPDNIQAEGTVGFDEVLCALDRFG